MRSRRFFIVPLILLTFFLGGIRTSFATVIIPLSLNDLVKKSSVIAHVKVIGQEVVSTSQAPFMVTTVEVIKCYKGNFKKGTRFQIWQWGDGFSHVEGDPVLYPEREGLVFAKYEDGKFYLTNLGQAWYDRVEEDGKIIAKESIKGLTLYLSKAHDPAPTSLLWDELITIIKRMVKGGIR